eukprot:1099394-Amphidinium_carterae.1
MLGLYPGLLRDFLLLAGNEPCSARLSLVDAQMLGHARGLPVHGSSMLVGARNLPYLSRLQHVRVEHSLPEPTLLKHTFCRDGRNS